MKYKTKTLITLVIVLTACNSNDKLNRACPTVCYPDFIDVTQHEVGVCTTGIPVCNEENVMIDCDWDTQKELYNYRWDICDGLDNNCDGKVDNSNYPTEAHKYNSWQILQKINPCDNMYGVCGNSTVKCIDGKLECILPDNYEEIEQSCDAQDNDCDGRIDEDIGNKELCFNDEFWKATNGLCRPGVLRCDYGEWYCAGEILPTEELCDEIDNDCNGIIDDTVAVLSEEYDIVFIIDTSGSMCGKIQAVAGALDAYVAQFENDINYRFALVIMSDPEDMNSLVQIDTNFTDIQTMSERLMQLSCEGAGWEASLDALFDVCTEENVLELNWREHSNRLAFMFTDEPAQTYRNPRIKATDVASTCLQSATIPAIWSVNTSNPDFLEITTNSNGLMFELVDDWLQIFLDLNSIIINLCID